MNVYSKDFSVATKQDDSPLTEADLASNSVILSGLSARSDIPILTEEALESFSGADEAGQYWLVDPLDGTKEFIKKNDEFTVNIALIQNGIPVLGVVYAPALDVAYMGAQGIGAYKVDKYGVRSPIHVTKHQRGDVWRVVGSRSHASQETLDWLEALDSYELVAMGSSLKICLVAEGEADLYPRLGPTCLWDTGAAHAVVRAAGGSIKTLDGVELSYVDTAEKLNPWFVVYGKCED